MIILIKRNKLHKKEIQLKRRKEKKEKSKMINDNDYTNIF